MLGVGLVVLLASISAGLDVRYALRWSLLCVVGGLVAYNLYAMGAVGSLGSSLFVRRWSAVLITALGSLVAVSLGAVWWYLSRRDQSQTSDSPGNGKG
jgi:hypothetical protein